MPIVPDTKNWTWVLTEPCPDCGYDGSRVPFAAVPALVRGNAAAWPARLAEPDARLRPNDDTWSPLEYGAHVRDVFRVFEGRLAVMLAEEAPTFLNWDQNASAVDDAYGAQDPGVVSSELLSAAVSVADAFERVDAAQLGRTGLRSDGSAFTVESLARYFAHDPVHHLWDVRGGTPQRARPMA